MSKIIFVLLMIATILSCKSSYTKAKQENPNELELNNDSEMAKSKTIYNVDSTTVKFNGFVTDVNNGCWVDATCSIKVNHKWWIAIKYGKRPRSFWLKERGKSTGIRFTKGNESIGKEVTVYAEIKGNKDQNKLTLEGSKTYYVKIIE